jgi:hypothetical protein
MAVSVEARTHFFERLFLFADSSAKLNGLVGLLASGVGHFFHIGDTKMCREIRRVLLTRWNLFSPDADVAPFVVANHHSRLISFLDAPKIRLFVDCLVELSDETMVVRASQQQSATRGAARTRSIPAYEKAASVGLGRDSPDASHRIASGDSLGSCERRADFLGALVGATGSDFGKSHQLFQDEKAIGQVFEIGPGAFGKPGVGGLHDKGLWLDIELGPHVYELTDEDRETMCIGIVSLVGGAVRAIEGEGVRLAVGALACPLICSISDDEHQGLIASAQASDEERGEESRETMAADGKGKSIEYDGEKAESYLEMGSAGGDAGDMLDILGIRAELAMSVGQGMGAFLARRGSCYALPQCPHSGSDPATTFLDEMRQRETVGEALRARIDLAFEIDSVARSPDLAKEELSKRFIWCVDPAP